MNRLKAAINRLLGRKWRLVRDWGWHLEWKRRGERVRVQWREGARDWCGWTVEVDQQRNEYIQVLANGFKTRKEALMLADLYMSTGKTIPAVVGPGTSQNEWLNENMEDHAWAVVDSDLGRRLPVNPGGRSEQT